MSLLPPDEIELQLKSLQGWRLVGDMILRDFVFPDFRQAMDFVNKVAALAETANHHPDIDIRYNKVRLCLTSHDAGGMTRRDFKMATAVSAMDV